MPPGLAVAWHAASLLQKKKRRKIKAILNGQTQHCILKIDRYRDRQTDRQTETERDKDRERHRI